MNTPPKLLDRDVISDRLDKIFPRGIENRNFMTRKLAASTVFVMLYVEAIAGNGMYISPQFVYSMTYEQAEKTEGEDRKKYGLCIVKRNCTIEGKRWYADNTRESIRDETIKSFLEIGAIVENSVPTTSPKPRYALQAAFAELFNPNLTEIEVQSIINKWLESNLSPSALARVAINRSSNTSGKVLVNFPNGETRHLEDGPSSHIAKSVIEIFAAKFLSEPVVLWLSESKNKVVASDNKLAKQLKLHIDVSKDLPDIILVDLKPTDPLIVFVEVVATDGAISEGRMKNIFKITEKAKFKRSQVLFVTAFMDRQSKGVTKTIRRVEWNSFIWFAAEHDNIFILKKGVMTLSDIMDKLT
jgi:hypothetical protein